MITTKTTGDVLLGKTRGAVLALLLGQPDEEYHVRQVVRLTSAGLGPVQRELKLLASIGILERREVGRQVFYKANPNSPVFGELRGLVLKTAGAAGAIAAALASLSAKINVAFIFGSIARGDQGRESDVDVMVIGTASFSDVARALIEPQRRLAREVNPSVYRLAEFAAKLRGGNHFLRNVMERPKVFLIGDEHELSGLAEEWMASAPQSNVRGSRGVNGRHRSRSQSQRRSKSRR